MSLFVTLNKSIDSDNDLATDNSASFYTVLEIPDVSIFVFKGWNRLFGGSNEYFGDPTSVAFGD